MTRQNGPVLCWCLENWMLHAKPCVDDPTKQLTAYLTRTVSGCWAALNSCSKLARSTYP